MIKCFEDAEAFERKVLEKYDFILPRVLTEFEKNVLGMIVKNPSLPNIELSKALQVSIQDINETIANLQNIGALDVEFNPTKAAESSIQRPTEEIFVVYSYEKNPKQTGEPTLLDTSRTFCRQMIGLDRLYTLDQLKLLRNDFNQSGLDIFTKRGGWYTLPGTTNHRPFCRHIWRQNVVRRKL
jgi:biotin operon repressor